MHESALFFSMKITKQVGEYDFAFIIQLFPHTFLPLFFEFSIMLSLRNDFRKHHNVW